MSRMEFEDILMGSKIKKEPSSSDEYGQSSAGKRHKISHHSQNEQRPGTSMPPIKTEDDDDSDNEDVGPALPDQTTLDLDEAHLRRVIAQFDKKVVENQQLRIKYQDEPTKFVESETELFAALDKLQGLATQPHLFGILIEKGVITQFINLLSHDNTDISCKIVSILQEYTDIDSMEDSSEFEPLINKLLEHNVIEQLVSNLDRLKEETKEESQGINNSLSIIENLIDYNPSLAKSSGDQLMKWLLKKMRARIPYDANKHYASEILSILLLNEKANRILLGNLNGVDTLLQQLSHYKRHAPVTADEHEYLENIFECLCTCIYECENNRQLFLKDEGVELINLILKEKKKVALSSSIKTSALKFFNHVLTSNGQSHNETIIKCCERFIEILGLRVLFPIFLNPKVIITPLVKKKELQSRIDEIEEHVVSILLALLKNCRNQEFLQRTIFKFIDSDFEKTDRLFELHVKYTEKRALLENELSSGKIDEEDRDIRKSDSSFALRIIDYMIILISYLADVYQIKDPISDNTIKKRLFRLMAMRSGYNHHESIISEMTEYMNEIENEEEKNSIELLLKSFGK